MKTYSGARSLSVGVMEEKVQSIALEDIDKATYILRSKMYSDKPKAALTETVCNAVDEHRKHGVKRPVDVIITKSEIIVRDYAKGLDKENVFNVFFQYFKSTKSNDNKGIGGFGVGAKAPGAYADVWYVESFYNGKRTLYASSPDGFAAKTSRVMERDCDPNNTGICVRIPLVNENDYSKFVDLGYDLYRMIGLNDVEDPINVYITHEKIDYNAWELSTDKFKEDCKLVDHKRLKDYCANGALLVDGVAIIAKGSSTYYGSSYHHATTMFRSAFFKSGQVKAYDGDIMYNVTISNDLVKKFGLSTGGYTIILMFERGEIQIAPTRETIETGMATDVWLEQKLQELSDRFNDEYSNKLLNLIPTSSDTLAAIYNTVVGSVPNIFQNRHFVLPNNDPVIRDGIKAAPPLHPDIKSIYEKSNNKATIKSFAAAEWRWDSYKVDKPNTQVCIVIDKPDYKAGKVAVTRVIEALHTHISKVNPNSCLLKSTHYVWFVKDQTEMDKWADSTFTSKYKHLWRKDKDYFLYSDIEKHLPKVEKKVKNTNGKPVNTGAILYKAWNRSMVQAVSDNPTDITNKTLFFSFKDIKNEGSWSSLLTPGDLGLVEWLTGFNQICLCKHSDVETWKNLGATYAKDVNIVKVLQNRLEKQHKLHLLSLNSYEFIFKQLCIAPNKASSIIHMSKDARLCCSGYYYSIDRYDIADISSTITDILRLFNCYIEKEEDRLVVNKRINITEFVSGKQDKQLVENIKNLTESEKITLYSMTARGVLMQEALYTSGILHSISSRLFDKPSKETIDVLNKHFCVDEQKVLDIIKTKILNGIVSKLDVKDLIASVR